MIEMIVKKTIKVQGHYSSTINHKQSVGMNAQYSLIVNCFETASFNNVMF